MTVFNQRNPLTTDVTLVLRKRRDHLAHIDNTVYGEVALQNCLVDHIGWSTAKGLWDDSEEDVIAINYQCSYHQEYLVNTGEALSHEMITKGCEIVIPEGAPMAGTWIIDSRPSCSADPLLGDVVRCRRK